LHLLAAAGITTFVFGVEALADRLLDVVQKGTTVTDILDSLQGCDAAGIDGICNLIPDYPTTTRQEAIAHMRMLVEQRDLFHKLKPSPIGVEANTALSREPEKFGLALVKGDVVSTQSIDSVRYVRTEGMTNEERDAFVPHYLSLLSDLNTYNSTRAVRNTIAADGFDWEKASFAFDIALIVESTISIQDGSVGAWFVAVNRAAPTMFLEFAARMKRVVALLREYDCRSVPFASFLEAYSVELEDDNGSRNVRDECIQFLTALVHAGFVSHVYGGACFKPRPSVKAALEGQMPDLAADVVHYNGGAARITPMSLLNDPTIQKMIGESQAT